MKSMKNLGYRHHKKLISILTAAGLLTTFPVLAAPPNSGSILEGAKPPSRQEQLHEAPSIRVEQQTPMAASDDSQPKILVTGFQISGEPPLPAAELLALLQSEAGREFTLDRLNELAGTITRHLRQQGYLVAFAYIPAQDVKDGIVEIAVVPGKYGQIKVNGEGVDSDRLRRLFFAVKPGALITREPLERALLLAGDLSGLSIKATLTPGEAAGTADLVLAVSRTDKVSGLFYADNWGNRYSGQIRSGVQITVNNPGGNGDQLNLGGLLTESSRMNDYNLGYQLPFGYDGARLSLSHSRVHYTLGEEFADLGANGQAVTDQLALSYPLLRSRSGSLTGTLGYEHKRLHDDITTVDTYSRKTSGLWNLGLSGDFSDNWLGGGANRFSLTQVWGRLTIDDADTTASDAATANTAGHFNKTVLSFQRQQSVAENLNFIFNVTGQLADKNLDSSEKLYLGGADGVRAYPQGEAAGDQGYRLNGEFRWRLPGLATVRDNVYLTSFYDYGSVRLNKQPYAGSGDNRRSLAGAGLGILWTRDRDFAVRMDYAWKLGHEQASADTDKSGRFWLQGVKYF
jgi:hemolysin activation/secretion protein